MDDQRAINNEPDENQSLAAQVTAARPKVKELLEQFRADPASEAGAILQALALKGWVEQELAEEDLRRLHHERQRSEALESSLRRLERRAERLERSTRRSRAKREQERTRVRSILSGAQESATQSKAFDQQEALRQIAEVIGLGGRPEHRREQAPGPSAPEDSRP